MSKNQDKLWEMLEDFTGDELVVLGDLVSGLNRLEMVDETPRYSAEEMDVIGRFQELPSDDDDELSDEEPDASQHPIAEDSTENPDPNPAL